MKQRELFWRVALLFLPLSVFGVFVVWPLLNTFYYSFTDWNGLQSGRPLRGAAQLRRRGD